MISAVFHAIIYNPLYNGLVFLVSILPGHDMGLAVVALTIVVRIIIFPLSRRAVDAQLAMKKVAPEVEELKKKYKKNSPEQSQAVFALYKERGIHPFASIGLVLIQFPVLIALYWVFYRGGFPNVDAALLYPFVHAPAMVNMTLLGIVSMTSRSIPLALLAAVTQYLYTRLSMGPREKTPDSSPVEASLSGDMAKSFDLQARYALPVMIGIIGYTVAAAAPLYWATSNTFMILQELAAGRRFNPKN
jgi:YidC/Oxa1 family membrane protein insertase